jgi:hypothetical protein
MQGCKANFYFRRENTHTYRKSRSAKAARCRFVVPVTSPWDSSNRPNDKNVINLPRKSARVPHLYVLRCVLGGWSATRKLSGTVSWGGEAETRPNRRASRCCVSSSQSHVASNFKPKMLDGAEALFRSGRGCGHAGPCGLQSFAPLLAGVFCPVPLSWLSDGATLPKSEHLCQLCPKQCPLLSFVWKGWEAREAREACRRHKTVGRWAPLKLVRISQWSQRLERCDRSLLVRRSSEASLFAFQCPLARVSFLHVWPASDLQLTRSPSVLSVQFSIVGDSRP